MRCVNCGKPLTDENAIFCDKCFKETTSNAQGASNESPETGNRGRKNSKKPNKKKLPLILSIIALVLVVFILLGFGLRGCIENFIDSNINKGTLSGDLGINSEIDEFIDEEVKNIALFGLDTRQNNSSGRSDAIIVLSIDKKNNKIKMTSIARDTYITFESGRKDKITHAWAYGKASLSVKTLNQNFGLDITDYVSINFYGFAEIIDYIGGVTIDINESEMKVMNNKYIPYIDALGIECEPIKQPGVQLVNGGQALAYARDRYTGSDIERGGRQREVLQAMFNKAKSLNVLKLPKFVEMILNNCTTTLSSSEMVSMGTWALRKSPSIENLGLPTKECGAKGQMINGTSYMVYDLELASKIMHDFIYSVEPENTSSIPVSSEK